MNNKHFVFPFLVKLETRTALRLTTYTKLIVNKNDKFVKRVNIGRVRHIDITNTRRGQWTQIQPILTLNRNSQAGFDLKVAYILGLFQKHIIQQ